MIEEVRAYLNEALDYIQEHSVMREHVDWPTLRQQVFTLAAHAQTPAETYPAIERALECLGDRHSFFQVPGQEQLLDEGKLKLTGVRAVYPEGIIGMVDPGSPAEKAGVQVGERIETINHQPITALTHAQFRKLLRSAQLDLTLRSGGQGSSRSLRLQEDVYEATWLPQGRRLEHNIGYLALPGLLCGKPEFDQVYAETTQQLIREIDSTAPRGWIIDLRRTVGGTMWPMWAGVGPVLGEGEIVAFVAPAEKVVVSYRSGQVSTEQWGVITEVNEPYQLKRPWPAVAVLTSPLTASAGEFAALAFRERLRTRSFGEPTCGVPTGNDDKQLSDGAMILLTTHLGADRTGRPYDDPLLPDQYVQIDWTRLGTVDDPVLQAAVRWLQTEDDSL
jgi:carboxyl-terminal processing protease